MFPKRNREGQYNTFQSKDTLRTREIFQQVSLLVSPKEM